MHIFSVLVTLTILSSNKLDITIVSDTPAAVVSLKQGSKQFTMQSHPEKTSYKQYLLLYTIYNDTVQIYKKIITVCMYTNKPVFD